MTSNAIDTDGITFLLFKDNLSTMFMRDELWDYIL